MNKYVKKLFLLIIMTFVYILTGNVNVYAVDDFCSGDVDFSGNIAGKAGGTSTCSSENCYSKRFGGMRVALVDDKGIQVAGTKIVDIWFYGKNTIEKWDGGTKSDTIYNRAKDSSLGTTKVYFKDKHLKQYYYGKTAKEIKSEITIGNISNDEYLAQADTYLDDSINSGDNRVLYGLSSFWKSNEYSLSSQEKNVRVANSAYTVMKNIYCNANNAKNTTGNYDNTYLKNLLHLMNKEITSGVDRYYIQYEPLVTWSNLDKTGSSYAFYGTITELNLVFKNASTIFDNNILNTYGNITVWGSASYPFNSYNANAYRGIDDVGVMMKQESVIDKTGENSFKTIPGNIFEGIVVSKDAYGNEIKPETTGKEVLNAKNGHFEAYGVGFMSLASFKTDCDTEARELITNGAYKNSDYMNVLYKNSAIKASCFDEKGNFKTSECYQLLPEFIEKVGIIPLKDSKNQPTGANLCEPKECEFIITYAPKVLSSKFNRDGQSYVGKPEYLESDYVSEYDAGIYYLLKNADNFFSSDTLTDMLEYDNYKQLNIPASCSGTPKCKVLTTASCSSTDGSFTLKDSSDLVKCILKGYAYNNLDKTKKFQTSLDSRYDTKEGNGYCQEEVTFNFPKSPELTKAGTLLQWGIGDVQKYGKFGTMTVTRTCWYGAGNGIKKADGPDYLDLSWISTINPEIKLYYKDGLPTDDSVDISKYSRFAYKNLKVSEPTSVVISKINGGGTKFDVEDYTKGFAWKDKATIVKYFTSTATFDIEYSDSLNWFADKSDDGEYKDLTEVEKDDSNLPLPKYLPLGYGLPTSFITPTNSNYGGAIGDTEKMNGYLYVTVANIGTKATGADDNYHFNKYIAYNLTDDSTTEKNAATNYLTYSCPFSIYNQLFGYDYGKADNTKKPKGLDVVFRTIKLVDSKDDVNNVFPGRAGTGRDAGYNWNRLLDEDDEQYDPVLFEKLISNKINDEEPLYHIVLTPSKIKDIRIKNKDINEPYTNMTDETYIFSKNTLAELTEEEFDERFKALDYSESEDKEAGERTNLINESIRKKKAKYMAKKDNYEPYKYAGSKFLSYLNETSGLKGICIDTYGSDTQARSEYYAKSEGCKSNLYLTD